MRTAIQPIFIAGRLAICVLAGLLVAAPALGRSADDTSPKSPVSSSTTHKTPSTSHKANPLHRAHQGSKKTTAAPINEDGEGAQQDSGPETPAPVSASKPHQAGVCGVDRVAAHGAATCHDAHAGGLCGRDGLCAQAHRGCRRRGVPGARPCLPARQALSPKRRRACARPGRRATCSPTMRIFWQRKAEHEAGNEAAAEALLHGFCGRYPDSIFDVAGAGTRGDVSCWR